MSSVLEYLMGRAWALTDQAFGQMFEVVLRRGEGIKLSLEDIAQIVAQRDASESERRRNGYQATADGVAVVPVRGFIDRHASMVGDISGPRGTSVDQVRRALRAAVADDGVQAIVLDVESPGGTVAGLNGLADEIRELRETKPIVTWAEDMMASGALWLGSQANRVVVGKLAVVGSIGAMRVIYDNSRELENAGITPLVVKSGKNKGLDTRGMVSDQQREQYQREVDEIRDQFVADIAAGRGADVSAIAALADGSVWHGPQAMERGLADEIGTFEDAVRIASALANRAGNSGAARRPGLTAEQLEPREVSMGKANEKPRAEAPDTPPAGAETTPAVTASSAPTVPAVDVEAIRAEGRKQERERVAAIQKAAAKGQEQLVAELVANEVPLATALARLNEDLKVRYEQRLDSMRDQHKQVGTTADDPDEGPEEVSVGATKPADVDAALRAAWEKSPGAQAEFDDVDSYVSYCKHENAGKPIVYAKKGR